MGNSGKSPAPQTAQLHAAFGSLVKEQDERQAPKPPRKNATEKEMNQSLSFLGVFFFALGGLAFINLIYK